MPHHQPVRDYPGQVNDHLAQYRAAEHADLVNHLMNAHGRPRGDFPMNRTRAKAAHRDAHAQEGE